jgi:hypothetical protein
MFKHAFIILLLLSQLCLAEAVQTGLQIGMNHSRFSGPVLPGKGVGLLPGFLIGGQLSWHWQAHLGLMSELNLTTRGCRINTIGDIQQSDIFIYAELPVLIKGYWRPVPCGPFLAVGSALNILILALNDVGMIKDIRGMDISLIVGGGFAFRKIALEFRLTRGLLNFNLAVPEKPLRHHTFSGLIGYRF